MVAIISTTSANIVKSPVYEESVFINCPFDRKYKALFHAMVFTIKACDFTPRCALEFEGDPNRLQKILNVISNCQFGVHDVSVPDGRLNMPLELGLFIGCQTYGNVKHKKKSYLILEGKPYSSKSYLSDMAGQDPMAHHGKFSKVIECLRDWLIAKSKTPSAIPSANYILSRYTQFRKELPAMCGANKWNEKNLLFPEFLGLAETWLELNF